MILKTRCSLEEDDFTASGVHPANTIGVIIEGPGAAKTPLQQIQNFIVTVAKNENITITSEELKNHYRNEEACKVYFPLPTKVDIQNIHGKSLVNGKLRFSALIPGREPKKIFLNYVPATISEHGLNTILQTFLDTRKIHHNYPHINGRLDRHLVIAETDALH